MSSFGPSTPAPEIGIEPVGEHAQPVIGIQERQPPLQEMVDLDSDAPEGGLKSLRMADVAAVAVERLEKHRVGHPDDQQAVESSRRWPRSRAM